MIFPMRKPFFKSLVAVFILFASLGFAQNSQQTQPASAATPAQSPTPQQPAQPAVPPQAQPSAQPAEPAQPSQPAQPSATPSHRLEIEPVEKGHKITPVEAKELFQSVDEILHFASRDTGLPIKKSVKRTVVSREQVEKYIGDKFKNDADRIRFERSELVQKKFGLLPRDFDLHGYLIKLLAEQVAGYYDEKSKTMNLLDWIEPELQRPVMAHELTHALQDQSYDLEKMSRHDEEIERKGLENLDEMIRNDEESTCRSAVVEGQAMIVLLDYILAPGNRNVVNAPEFVDMMESQMKKSGDSPVFDSAPLLLREELTFPYRDGMKFIRDLLVARGKDLAFKGVLERMPQTTREIMEPREYLAGHRVPPLLLPDLKFLKKNYEPFDAGAVGELDVNILLRIYADEDVAKRLTPEWRGGAYYAAGRKGAKPPDRNSTAHVGLYYISKWATEDAAQEFAKVYADALAKRYKELRRVHGYAPEVLQWASADGPILIQQTGNMVIAVESFDEDVAKRLMQTQAASR